MSRVSYGHSQMEEALRAVVNGRGVPARRRDGPGRFLLGRFLIPLGENLDPLTALPRMEGIRRPA